MSPESTKLTPPSHGDTASSPGSDQIWKDVDATAQSLVPLESTIFEGFGYGPSLLKHSMGAVSNSLGTATTKAVQSLRNSMETLNRAHKLDASSDKQAQRKNRIINDASEMFLDTLDSLSKTSSLVKTEKGKRRVETLRSLLSDRTDHKAWQTVADASTMLGKADQRRVLTSRKENSRVRSELSSLKGSWLPYWVSNAPSTAPSYAGSIWSGVCRTFGRGSGSTMWTETLSGASDQDSKVQKEIRGTRKRKEPTDGRSKYGKSSYGESKYGNSSNALTGRTAGSTAQRTFSRAARSLGDQLTDGSKSLGPMLVR